MVLLNLETLTDSELQSIASQEDIDDWESLSREELIEEIESIYEDAGDLETSGTLKQKYLNTLNPGNTDFGRLPGVSDIPKHYNKTYINLTQKDDSWVYVFWNLSENEYKQVEDVEGISFVIRAVALAENGKSELSYDIGITIHDKCWTVEMPWPGRTYVAKLVKINEDGSEEIVCTSNTVYRPISWLSTHRSAIEDPKGYTLLVKPLISRDGVPVNCNVVNNIIYGDNI